MGVWKGADPPQWASRLTTFHTVGSVLARHTTRQNPGLPFRRPFPQASAISLA